MTTFTRGCFGHCPDCGVEVEVDGVTGCICIPDTDADTNTITTEKCPCMGAFRTVGGATHPSVGAGSPTAPPAQPLHGRVLASRRTPRPTLTGFGCAPETLGGRTMVISPSKGR